MNLLLYMAPIAVVFLLPATLLMEENVVGITLALAREDIKIIWYLLFNSALAYFVNLTNFLVTKHTSALTLQVCSHVQIHSIFLFSQFFIFVQLFFLILILDSILHCRFFLMRRNICSICIISLSCPCSDDSPFASLNFHFSSCLG